MTVVTMTTEQKNEMSRLLMGYSSAVVKTLADCKAPVEVDRLPNVFANAGLIEVYVKPKPGTKVDSVLSRENDIALALRQPSTRLTQGVGNIVVQIPHGERARLTIESMLSTQRKPYAAIAGRDLYGKPIFAELSDDSTPHVLIAGASGSGKTALAQSMVLSLVQLHARNSLRLIVIDPKADRWWFTPKINNHLAMSIAHTPAEAQHALKLVCEHMQKVESPVSRLVIYVDEMADVVMTGGDDVMQNLTRIAQRGREAGIHLIGCTQKPSAKQLGPLLANFTLRFVGRVVNGSDSNLACGQPGCGAEKLRGNGDFLRIDGERVTRMQAAMPKDYRKPNPNAPHVEPEWSTSPPAPPPQPSPAPVSVQIESPTPAPMEAEPPPSDDLLDMQARVVLWYRRAVPKETYTQTELARVVWPDMVKLAGGFARRLPKIIARADEMDD